MSLNKSATIRRTLLGASSLALAAFAIAQPAFAQTSERPQVTFPASGNFANITTSAGDDTITVAPDNALYLPIWSDFGGTPQESVTKDFLGGTNTITNNGYLFVGMEHGQVLFGAGRTGAESFSRDNTRYEAYMRMENLTTFNNNGSIYLGSFYEIFSTPTGLVGSDRWADDILSMPGATFIGGEDSRVFLDVNFNATAPQTACNPGQRITEPVEGDTGSGSLPISDCIDLTGGSASGRTALIIHDIMIGDRGAYNPDGAVIIDMEGGDDISPAAFYVGGSANSSGYDPRNDGGIDKGLFLYTLGYDSSDQKFRLYGVQSAASRQLPILAHAAADLWRTSSGGWFERQTGRRDEAGQGGGLWGHIAYGRADRGVTDVDQVGDKVLTFDNSYEQEDTTLTFGADLISADGAGGSWTVGAMIGYAHSKVAFNDYANSANLEGMHGGVYGAFTSGDFFLDAALDGTSLDLDSDVPSMDLVPAGTLLGTSVRSLGARAEAGLRLGNERLRLEPIAGASYLRTVIDDMTVPADDPARLGGEVSFDDATSLRASAGLRLSVEDFVPLTDSSRLSLTARHGKEFDGEASATIVNVGPDVAPVLNNFDGQFSEISAGFTVANADETVAGYINFDALFGDDYDRLGGSVGLRFQW